MHTRKLYFMRYAISGYPGFLINWQRNARSKSWRGSRARAIALDGEIFQRETTDANANISRDQAARHRHSDIWLQEPCGHRPGAWFHKGLDGDECGGSRWRSVEKRRDQGHKRRLPMRAIYEVVNGFFTRAWRNFRHAWFKPTGRLPAVPASTSSAKASSKSFFPEGREGTQIPSCSLICARGKIPLVRRTTFLQALF
jgi:hypothetical protein